MITAENIDCTIHAAAERATATVNCAREAGTELSIWEVASTITNWGLLAVAAGALIVSFLTFRHTRQHSAQALADNFKATQAQLDASRAAVQADLDERKNSRELDITASLVSALDEMQMAVAMNPEDENRTAIMAQTSSRLMSAFSRFDLFVKESGIIRSLLTWLVQRQMEFEPRSVDDFESQDFERMVRVQGLLRLGIVEFQQKKSVIPPLLIVQAALSAGDLATADAFLFISDDT